MSSNFSNELQFQVNIFDESGVHLYTNIRKLTRERKRSIGYGMMAGQVQSFHAILIRFHSESVECHEFVLISDGTKGKIPQLRSYCEHKSSRTSHLSSEDI